MEHRDDDFEFGHQFGGDEEEEEEEEAIDVDSPDELDVDAEPDDDSDMEVYHMETNGAANGNGRQVIGETGDEEEDDDYDEEDAMTWDSMSTISEVEVEKDDDEWYPLMKRDNVFPNFALPTTTRAAFRIGPQPIASADPSSTPGSSEHHSDTEDVEFNDYKEVMRPDPTREELQQLVIDHFLHHGYSEVIETFSKEVNIVVPKKDIDNMNARNEVRRLICVGEMESAIEKMTTLCPTILEDDEINFIVRKQHLIEMVRQKLTKEPVEYFRAHLMKNGQRPCDEKMDIIERIFTMLVFNLEDDVEFNVYFQQSEREQTAKEVNSALLAMNGKLKSSRLDLLAKTIAFTGCSQMRSSSPSRKHATIAEFSEEHYSKPYGLAAETSSAFRGEVDLTQDMR